jgi:DNA polymerase sigma
MEKPTLIESKPEENNIKNNNIEDEDDIEIQDETNEQEIADQDLTPEAQEATIKRDLPILKELIILVFFGPLLPQELAELYSQYTGQNLRKKTKVPVKEFLKGHKPIFQFILKHQVVEEEASKKKQKLELIALKMDHPIVKEVLADPPLNTNTSSDYSHMSTKVVEVVNKLKITDQEKDVKKQIVKRLQTFLNRELKRLYPTAAIIKKTPANNTNNTVNRGSNQITAKNNNNSNVAQNSTSTSEPLRKQTRAQRFFEEGTDFFLSGFGSSFNAMGTTGSDLDLTLIYPQTFTVDIQDLIQKVRKLFFRTQAQVKKMVVISQARVPIIKFRDEISNYECDLSFNHAIQIKNTELLKSYAMINPRVRQLGIFIKHWAKNRKINSVNDDCISSYAWVILVIYFLQRTSPPVLPFLQQSKRPADVKNFIIHGADCYFDNYIVPFKSASKDNKQSIGELLHQFFRFLATFDFENNVINIRTPSLITKEEKNWQDFKMAIEDPFETDHNLGKKVNRIGWVIMQREIKRAVALLSGTSQEFDTLLDVYKI